MSNNPLRADYDRSSASTMTSAGRMVFWGVLLGLVTLAASSLAPGFAVLTGSIGGILLLAGLIGMAVRPANDRP